MVGEIGGVFSAPSGCSMVKMEQITAVNPT